MLNTGAPIGTIARNLRFYLRRSHTPCRVWNLASTLKYLLTRPIHAPNIYANLKIDASAACQLACPGGSQANPEFKAKTRAQMMSSENFKYILEDNGDYLYRIQFFLQKRTIFKQTST